MNSAFWFPVGGSPPDPYAQILPCFVTLSYISVPNALMLQCSCRGSMSLILVTRQRLQSHSSGIQFVIVVTIIIVIVIIHVFIVSVVGVTVKVVSRCELLSHSHKTQ